MERCRGTSVIVGRIGARGHISGSRKFEVHDYGPNIVRNNNGTCVPAAVSNACGSLYGEHTALPVKNILTWT